VDYSCHAQFLLLVYPSLIPRFSIPKKGKAVESGRKEVAPPEKKKFAPELKALGGLNLHVFLFSYRLETECV
jgi:hypothetical protein